MLVCGNERHTLDNWVRELFENVPKSVFVCIKMHILLLYFMCPNSPTDTLAFSQPEINIAWRNETGISPSVCTYRSSNGWVGPFYRWSLRSNWAGTETTLPHASTLLLTPIRKMNFAARLNHLQNVETDSSFAALLSATPILSDSNDSLYRTDCCIISYSGVGKALL